MSIIRDTGLTFIEYPYFNDKSKGLYFKGMKNFLLKGALGTIVLLHACAHNPIGVNSSI